MNKLTKTILRSDDLSCPSCVTAIEAALLAGYDIVQRAWARLMNRQISIELLVSIAAIGGLSIGVYR